MEKNANFETLQRILQAPHLDENAPHKYPRTELRIP